MRFIALTMTLLAALSAACACDPALSRGDCPVGWFEIGGTCRLAIGADCSGGKKSRCLTNYCVPSGVGDAAYCTDECASAADCPGGFECIDTVPPVCARKVSARPGGGVAPAGGGDAPAAACLPMCPPGTTCENGQCVVTLQSECLSQTDCDAGKVCLNGVCGDAATSAGVPCDPTRATPCPTGLQCLEYTPFSGICTTSCRADDECGAGESCRPIDVLGSFCLPGENDCPVGIECYNTACSFVLASGGSRVVASCRDPDFSLAQFGEGCTPGTVSCIGGLCPDDGICSAPCAVDAVCPGGYVCEPLTFTQNGARLTAAGCRPVALSRGLLGEDCPMSNPQCQSNVCIDEGPGGAPAYCTRPCDPSDPCPAEYVCTPYAGHGGVCLLDAVSSECLRDDECGVGQVCAPVVDAAAHALRVTCTAAIENGRPPGSPCGGAEGGVCANGLCQANGACGAICATAADCPAGMVCGFESRDVGDGLLKRFRSCIADPGSRTWCTRDGDCGNGEACGVFFHPRSGAVLTECRTPGPGGGSGDPCAVNDDCRSGVCTAGGSCAAICATSADCPDLFLCTQVAVSGGGPYGAMVLACVHDPGNFGQLGAPCPNGRLDCPGLLCYQDGSSESFCTTTCVTDLECGDGAPVCRKVTGSTTLCTPGDYIGP